MLFLLFFIGTAMFSKAQDISYGVKLGYNQASLDGDDIEDYKWKIGPALGGFAKINISNKFAFQPEVLFVGNGTKIEDGGDSRINVFDVAIPMRFQFYTGASGNDYGFKIALGPQLNNVISDKIASDFDQLDGEDFSDVFENFQNIEVNDFRVGGLLNFGYEFQSGLWIETGGYHDITPYVETDTGQGVDKNYNTSGAFTIGYNFGQ